MTQATPLIGREETQGRPYPLWIERVLLVLAAVAFVMGANDVAESIDHPVLGPLAAYLAFPLILLAVVELLGRMVQTRHVSKL